ncbi:MAG TPA: amidoligase family protein, partial [Candidatus Obscuribacterales bacterium]
MSKQKVMTDIFGTRKYKGERLGIEVELENVRDPERGFEQIEGKQFWAMVHDGSLRNNGVEYLTNPPFKYDELPEVLQQLETIVNAVPDSRATCRTGLHVHVNVSDMTVEQVRNMILLSVLYEPGLIWHCGEDRASNIYSLASSQGDFILGHINQMMHGDSNRFGHHVIGCRELKYSSLNIGAIAGKGTLEYRMHRGTKSSQDIGKWVDILVGIRRIACEAESPDHIINGIEMLRERAADIGLSPSSITRRSERRANLLLIPNVECPRFSESPTIKEKTKEWDSIFGGTPAAGDMRVFLDEVNQTYQTMRATDGGDTLRGTRGHRLFGDNPDD